MLNTNFPVPPLARRRLRPSPSSASHGASRPALILFCSWVFFYFKVRTFSYVYQARLRAIIGRFANCCLGIRIPTVIVRVLLFYSASLGEYLGEIYTYTRYRWAKLLMRSCYIMVSQNKQGKKGEIVWLMAPQSMVWLDKFLLAPNMYIMHIISTHLHLMHITHINLKL